MSEVNADVKKKALCWTRYMSDNDVCWTRGQSQKKRILYTPFFWHSIGWVEIFYLFIFIWEVWIQHWSRNLSQKFYRDGSEIQIDVSSHFDEAKSKSMYRRILMERNPNWCIVAFWWSEIQIDVSSHFDEAKTKSMYRRIVIERNSNWCIVESRELERRRVCRVSPFESEDECIESHDESEDEYVESCDYLVERRWVYRISWLLRAKTSISSLASRAKMSMSNLANMAEMNMSNPAIESEDEYVESCNFGTITSFVAVMHALLTGFVSISSALCIVGFIVIYKNSD